MYVYVFVCERLSKQADFNNQIFEKMIHRRDLRSRFRNVRNSNS